MAGGSRTGSTDACTLWRHVLDSPQEGKTHTKWTVVWVPPRSGVSRLRSDRREGGERPRQALGGWGCPGPGVLRGRGSFPAGFRQRCGGPGTGRWPCQGLVEARGPGGGCSGPRPVGRVVLSGVGGTDAPLGGQASASSGGTGCSASYALSPIRTLPLPLVARPWGGERTQGEVSGEGGPTSSSATFGVTSSGGRSWGLPDPG